MGVLLRVPDHAYAHFLMGLTLTLTHRPSQGIVEYERALALDSNLVQKRPMVDFHAVRSVDLPRIGMRHVALPAVRKS